MAALTDTINLVIRAKDQASAAIAKTQGGLAGLNDTLAKHQRQFAVASAAIVGGLGAMAVGAREQVKTQKQLDVALAQIGVSYKANKADIEGLIASQQNLTGVSDELQRKTLALLVAQFGNLEDATA